MDPNRFDALTRRTATATTRRGALRGLVGGSLLAALGVKAATIPDAAAQGTCTLDWTGNVRLGPDAGVMIVPGAALPGELKGTMTLSVGGDGAIEQGQLTVPDGTTMTVVGQATGRALSLRLTDGSGRVLVAIGTGEQAITACAGRIDGSLTGPQTGDLGEWHAVASGGTTGAPAGAATTNPPAGSSDTGSNPPGSDSDTDADPPGSDSDTDADPPTGGDGSADNCASGVVCDGVCCAGAPGLTPDSITCNGGVCECAYSCLSAGCGGGDGVIVNTCGSDPAPHCHSECNVPDDTGCGDMTCPEGETLDIDTCTCVPDTGCGDMTCPEGETLDLVFCTCVPMAEDG